MGSTAEHPASQFIVWRPDGQQIINFSRYSGIWIWDAVDGRHLAILKDHTGHINAIALSPDGHLLASAAGEWSAGEGDNVIYLWDMETYENLRSLEGHTDRVMSISWSPDGTQLASGSLDGTIRIWDID
jgi:WD40 repeat protein